MSDSSATWSAENSRIAKNSIFLYIRMFFTMLIGLYTSRVLLKVLGVQDYGIYEVVGGIITFFTFLNTTMAAATMSTGNQIFVFDMGESVKIDDLARRMIRLAGFKPDEDIKIEYSGLRPGEKLYEEVLSNRENTIPTDHSRIRIAKVREYDYTDAQATTDQLEQLSREVNIDEMVRLMKRIVPEYISQNSRFEALDK